MHTIDAGPAPESTTQMQEKLYRFSAWIHIGEGADDCEQRETGDCPDLHHFHAWCRMPNQTQHEEIRERALAARARRARVLRDPESDAHAALEMVLDELARGGDAMKEALADELLSKQRWQAQAEALADVIETEDGVQPMPEDSDDDPEPAKPYEHVARDRTRLDELQAMKPADRPADEFAHLTRHLAAFDAQVDARFHELYDPQLQSLLERDISALVDLVRDDRIARDAHADFMKVFTQEQWLECALARPGGSPRFESMEQIRKVSPEEWEALRATFDGLEAEQVNPGN